MVDTRSEFIRTTVIGILIGVFFVWWNATQSQANPEAGFSDYVFFFFMGICVPFGWKFLTYLQSFFPLSIFGTFWFWIIYGIVKLVLSMIIGIPAFIYQLVKTILTQRKINRLK